MTLPIEAPVRCAPAHRNGAMTITGATSWCNHALRVEQVQPISRLLGSTRVDEQLDHPLAVDGDALVEVGGAAGIVLRRERTAYDHPLRGVGQRELEIRIGDRM